MVSTGRPLTVLAFLLLTSCSAPAAPETSPFYLAPAQNNSANSATGSDMKLHGIGASRGAELPLNNPSGGGIPSGGNTPYGGSMSMGSGGQ